MFCNGWPCHNAQGLIPAIVVSGSVSEETGPAFLFETEDNDNEKKRAGKRVASSASKPSLDTRR